MRGSHPSPRTISALPRTWSPAHQWERCRTKLSGFPSPCAGLGTPVSKHPLQPRRGSELPDHRPLPWRTVLGPREQGAHSCQGRLSWELRQPL